MNIWIAVAPPMIADILVEYLGRSVVGHWRNPSAQVIIDIQCSTEEYEGFKIRPGVTVWGAWDESLTVRDPDTGEILVGNKVEARPNIIDIVPDIVTRDENGNEIGRERPTVFSQVHMWLGQEDREV